MHGAYCMTLPPIVVCNGRCNCRGTSTAIGGANGAGMLGAPWIVNYGTNPVVGNIQRESVPDDAARNLIKVGPLVDTLTPCRCTQLVHSLGALVWCPALAALLASQDGGSTAAQIRKSSNPVPHRGTFSSRLSLCRESPVCLTMAWTWPHRLIRQTSLQLLRTASADPATSGS